MKKSKRKSKKVGQKVNKDFFENIPSKYRNLLAALIIIIPIIYIFSPYLFDGLRPVGTDVVASKGQTNLYKEWQEKTGETALWNPNIFSGMPTYHRITPSIIHVDTIISFLGKAFYWAFFYFLVGSFGVFFLLRYKGIPWFIAVIVAIAFALLTDWQAQIGDGHFTKLRAIMIMPWLILSFNYFFDKNSWLGVAAFAFIFSWMIRTQHFQIVFYGILILLFLFIYPYIKLFINKKYNAALSLFFKFAVAIILTTITASQPFLSIKEYTPFSTRGGNPVELGQEQESAKKSGGVSFDYATRWSLAPAELMDFFIQRFHGGISGEKYDGDEYPQLIGRQVPGYWGQKPFSGNYAYMGMILFLFAIIGVTKNYKDQFVLALAIFAAFSILLAFGRHFPALYKLFFYYVPYFSKFRAPSIFANISFLSFLLLAGYGIKSLLNFKHSQDTKLLFSIFGGAMLFTVLVLLLKDSFTYIASNESGRYDANTLKILTGFRKEFLTTDTIRLLIILIFTTVAVSAFYFSKIKREVFLVLLLVLVLIELIPANQKAFDKIELNQLTALETTNFSENEITQFLKNKNHTDRLLVLGQEFQSNHYSYFHPTINGYSAIKMQLIQDINEHSLYNFKSDDRINWNIINMLNGKYILLDGMAQFPFLKQVAFESQAKKFLYENDNALPKAWFVKQVKPLEKSSEIIKYMNDTTFNPSIEACLIENDLPAQTKFSGEGKIEVTEYTPNTIRLKVETDSPQFLVLSELFYPPGWKAFINENESRIFQTNHLLRGIEVNAGTHEIIFEMTPHIYYTSITISWIGNLIILFIFIIFG